ncbi:type I pantothenate kinase [Mammaliicoccus stepanovicii]|uniref:Pantothenate kinase n=1 Tax=Mammaliicoccus stepanovicii TaxID=643214 RepID=A0A240AEJ9_9STAP|nr:type I pantothenate kinase [Mammaliicoccus stepanovicii]PNZ77748.1 type I pantothenate kinase [Mammaliicoccus stepanovicii]GGI42827.1 pantothenate kinase [Mammaliicoccus stepanovicii]SNV81699.1 Pantothenate kinase [Mammaliicoccus stepanovicii]
MKFTKEEWHNTNFKIDMDISHLKLDEIISLNDNLTISEIDEVYLPLTQFLSNKVHFYKDYSKNINSKLLKKNNTPPFIIGISGGVSVGKSTVSRLLLQLLQEYNSDWKVDLITTDGYIMPKQQLISKDLLSRKGFPESYDTKILIDHLKKIKNNVPNIPTYTYSHITYDRLKDQYHNIDNPDILIIEGVNIFQVSPYAEELVSDYIDYKIYLDSTIENMKKWYITRFLLLQEEAFQKPDSHFYKYKDIPKEEAITIAKDLWENINEVNLIENILPTKNRSDLILYKNEKHVIENLKFNKF